LLENTTQFKTNFNKIKDIRTQVMFVFHALEIKLTKLKTTTNEFIKTNKNNIFIFGLDSFQFQEKLIDYEYNDMQRFYFALNNRMYCEYYKLHKLILNYTEETIGTNKNIEMLKSQNVFPIYKDLEPFKQYNFETIEEIHKTIINLLNNLNDHILSKELQLQLFQLKQKSGLNINNFVNTFDFDVIVIKQKCLLYLSYLDFLHNIHTKHFKRFSKKMRLMNDYLDEDIKFDEGMNTVEDDGMNSNDSIKSSTSTSSLDTVISPKNSTNNEIIDDNKPSMKSLFKSNVKKVINSLRITKPDNSPTPSQVSDKNISPKLSSVNINEMLDTLTNSFDIPAISPRPKYETMFSLSSKSRRGLSETAKITDSDVQIGDKSDTIYAVVSELPESKFETTSCELDAVNVPKSTDNSETINAHDLNTVTMITESIMPPQISDKPDIIYDHNLNPIDIIIQPQIGDNTNILSKAKKKQNQKKKQKK